MDLLEQYTAARTALAEYFGTNIWYNIVIIDDKRWTDYGEPHLSVGWEFLSDEDGFNYGIEVYGTSRWESKDGKYTLFIGNDGCGNRDCYIFLNSLKMSYSED